MWLVLELDDEIVVDSEVELVKHEGPMALRRSRNARLELMMSAD